MARSRLCADDKGAKKCKNMPADEQKGIKGDKEAKDKKYKYRKEVVYTERESNPDPTKVEEKTRLVVSDAIKEEQKPDTKGIIFEGQTSQRTTESGNKEQGKEDISRISETRFYKRRSKIGKLLTGETEKKVGGIREEQTKKGEKQVTTWKGSGRKTKMYTEKDDVKNKERERYEAAKKDPFTGTETDASRKRANEYPFISKRVKGTDTDYELGNRTDKEWRVNKKTYKSDVLNPRRKNKSESVKVRRSALSNQRKNG